MAPVEQQKGACAVSCETEPGTHARTHARTGDALPLDISLPACFTEDVSQGSEWWHNVTLAFSGKLFQANGVRLRARCFCAPFGRSGAADVWQTEQTGGQSCDAAPALAVGCALPASFFLLCKQDVQLAGVEAASSRAFGSHRSGTVAAAGGGVGCLPFQAIASTSEITAACVF